MPALKLWLISLRTASVITRRKKFLRPLTELMPPLLSKASSTESHQLKTPLSTSLNMQVTAMLPLRLLMRLLRKLITDNLKFKFALELTSFLPVFNLGGSNGNNTSDLMSRVTMETIFLLYRGLRLVNFNADWEIGTPLVHKVG
jgi:hypothetical protein